MLMTRLVLPWLIALAVSGAATQVQEPPPTGPFKAVHLVSLTDAEVAALQDAIAELNAVVAKAGHPDVRYRLYKVVGKQAGDFNYLWESTWPSGAVYQKVHDSPEWAATVKKQSAIDALMKKEVYNRYVEVTRPAR
jgi:hypothetical protein